MYVYMHVQPYVFYVILGRKIILLFFTSFLDIVTFNFYLISLYYKTITFQNGIITLDFKIQHQTATIKGTDSCHRKKDMNRMTVCFESNILKISGHYKL